MDHDLGGRYGRGGVVFELALQPCRPIGRVITAHTRWCQRAGPVCNARLLRTLLKHGRNARAVFVGNNDEMRTRDRGASQGGCEAHDHPTAANSGPRASGFGRETWMGSSFFDWRGATTACRPAYRSLLQYCCHYAGAVTVETASLLCQRMRLTINHDA